MTYKSVTIWHKTNKAYKRLLFDHATVTKKSYLDGNAVGQTENNDILIRLYSLYDPGISTGDRLCIGYEEALLPPNDSYVISEVTGFFNSSANLRHCKIKCR